MNVYKFKKFKLLVITILIMLTVSFTPNISYKVGAQQDSNQEKDIQDYISNLEEKFFLEDAQDKLKRSEGQIVSEGYDSNGTLIDKNVTFIQNNAIGSVAFMKHYDVTGDSKYYDWAIMDIYPSITRLKEDNDLFLYSSETNEDLNRTFALDQFRFIEYMCDAIEYDITNNQLIKTIVDSLENTDIFEAGTETNFNNASVGAYWTGLQDDQKLTESEAAGDNSYDSPYVGKYNYPTTSISLWAAASYAHFVSVMEKYLEASGQDVLLSKSYLRDVNEELEIILEKAQNAMNYADIYAWNDELGLYNEYQGLTSDNYYASTQLSALLASIRLFQATGKVSHLQKADLIIDSIISKFMDSGTGGLVSNYTDSVSSSNRFVNKLKYSQDNQMFVYLLCELAELKGQNRKRFVDFWEFERETNKYMMLAKDGMKFLNEYMWAENGDITGYISSVNHTNDVINGNMHISTNSLGLYNLNVIKVSEMPFNVFYQSYIIYMLITLGAIIIIAYLIRRGGFGSSGLSKEVRGLM